MDARAALIASRPGATAYAQTLAGLPQSLVGAHARVGGLAIYPVKGLGALRLPAARVEAHGLVDPATGLADRGVMLAYRRAGASPNGEPYDAVSLSNRNEPAFTLARASIAGGALVYEAPGLSPLRLDPSSLRPREGERTRVKLAYDGGPVLEGAVDDGPLAAWVRDLLRAKRGPRRYDPDDVVAVRPLPAHARPVAERHRAGQDAQTLFGDGAHALVASSSTLEWMNRALAADGLRTIAMEAFRPNLILDGLAPNAEDLVAEVAAVEDPAMRVVFATLCIRCDATCVDPATGKRPDAQPLAWLARNRPPRDGQANAATFAINAVFPRAAQGLVLRTGEVLRVVAER